MFPELSEPKPWLCDSFKCSQVDPPKGDVPILAGAESDSSVIAPLIEVEVTVSGDSEDQPNEEEDDTNENRTETTAEFTTETTNENGNETTTENATVTKTESSTNL